VFSKNYIIQLGNNNVISNKKIVFEILSKCSYYGILFVGFVYVLGQLGFNLNTVLVVLGSVGLAVALALQSSIANIASGFMILTLDLFDIGDLIESDKTTIGHVDSFNLFNTSIKDLNSTIVHIPNTTLVNSKLINYYRMKEMDMTVLVNISNYDNSTNIDELLKEIVNKLREKCIYTSNANKIVANVSDMSTIGTVLKVQIPIESKNYLDAKFMAQNIIRETVREKHVFLHDYFYKNPDLKMDTDKK
jgi:small conductance mechanosensitive channel